MSMTTLRIRLAGILFLLAALATSARARDVVIDLPAGWLADPHWAVCSAQGDVATGISPATGGPASRLFQRRAQTSVVTDVPGFLTGAAYSAAGDRLVAYYTSVGSAPSSHVALIDAVTGAIIWTREDTRALQFTPTGEALFGWRPAGSSGEVETFDLAGNTLRRLRSSAPIAGAVAFGPGMKVAVIRGRSIDEFDLTNASAPVVTWSHSLTPTDHRPSHLRALPNGRLLVEQDFGWFKVLDANGAVLYSYDPEVLGAADVSRDWDHYANLKPFNTVDDDELFLFSVASPEALILNLVSGRLTRVQVDTATPAGFTMKRQPRFRWLVMIGTTSLRMRLIPGLP
jgi:hypothetical protein